MSTEKVELGSKFVKEMSQYTLELAMEVVDDFRILFDFMLPLILLYGPERQQYKRLRENATVNSHNDDSMMKQMKQEVLRSVAKPFINSQEYFLNMRN